MPVVVVLRCWVNVIKKKKVSTCLAQMEIFSAIFDLLLVESVHVELVDLEGRLCCWLQPYAAKGNMYRREPGGCPSCKASWSSGVCHFPSKSMCGSIQKNTNQRSMSVCWCSVCIGCQYRDTMDQLIVHIVQPLVLLPWGWAVVLCLKAPTI